ncbi:GatB/YqeY domain-containing protein [soil metagenome]
MLRDRLTTDLKEAVKAKDATRISTLRLILAAVKDRDIAVRTGENAVRTGENAAGVGDAEIIVILAKMVRQRAESAAAYEEAGRLELAAREREEIRIIKGYLPKQMSEGEVDRAIETAIRDVGATSIRDMGRIMAWLKARHTGRMDFAKAGAAIKNALR